MSVLRNVSTIIVLITVTLSTFSQSEPCAKAGLVVSMMEKFHYDPVPIDDDFSQGVFTDILDALDPERTFFLQGDIDALQKHISTLDEAILRSNCEFLDQVIEVYAERLTEAKQLINEAASEVVPFETKEPSNFLSTTELGNYALDAIELTKRWRELLNYSVLVELVDRDLDSAQTGAIPEDELREREPLVREQVKNRYQRSIQRILDLPTGFNAYITEEYLNAIAHQYDPHSAYFSPVGRSDFQEALSSEKLSFGMQLKGNADGEVEILRLIPGGPAWESGQLHAGDILSSATASGKETLALTVGSWHDQISSLSGSENRPILFTVRKKNGEIQTVRLVKGSMRADDTIIKSYVLQGEHRIGYIVLPGFYTEWTDANPLGCANDVAKELLKLQKEDIEGLVLDLRSNGGGSLQEAVDLAGIFIDAGPILISDLRAIGKPQTIKDFNRGTIYDGPMVVLLNGYSASASEVVAAALKDHNRAVLVGSTTFGKASGQVILPIDTSLSIESQGLNPEKSDMGYIKITTQKLFRINCVSHQRTGVAMDIELPDPYADLEFRESDYKNALDSATIVKKVYFTPGPELPIKELRAASEVRVGSSRAFALVRSINDEFRSIQRQSETVTLSISEFWESEKRISELRTSAEKIEQDHSNVFEIINHGFDRQVNQVDHFASELNADRIKHIRGDIYIEETFHIVSDLIETEKDH